MKQPFFLEMTKYLVFSLLAILMLGCSAAQPPQAPAPKNIILLIGDGMGLTQVSTLYLKEGYKPHFSRFPVTGLVQTSAASHKITDSAAGATAFSTGKRTYNGAVGVASDTSDLENICERLAKNGLVNGLVATSSIQHATPASFYAHVPSRYHYEDIATQLAGSPIDFVAGGGLKYFANRADSVNYLDSLMAAGFEIYTQSIHQGDLIRKPTRKAYLLAEDAMPQAREERGEFLIDATHKAISHLTALEKPGYFLMVESSQIDWGGHQNDAAYIQTEMEDFDQLLGWVLDYAQKDGETLVIVTADHETGGFALSGAPHFGKVDYSQVIGTFSTKQHTASLVPLFAFGPGSQVFSGVYPNTDVYHKIIALLNLTQNP